VTPIWFVLDGDDVVLTTSSSGVKGRALRRDPNAALCVDEPSGTWPAELGQRPAAHGS
jgi:nitroimidazol reductase NimA-like FMN-containing flavoprotein (pyridoxamine 5'-phosphate oxidase superfamily)